jgi:anti-sigma regulatory factor (Ser/Thr protein kinase)
VDAVEFERISYPATAESCPAIREDVRAWLDGSGVPGEVSRGVVLAVSEAIDNVVTHAYGAVSAAPSGATIDLTLVLDRTEVVVTIADHGHWAQPETTDLEHDASDRPAQHGRGIILMNSHVDEVAIHHDRDGTSVLLRSRLVREDA